MTITISKAIANMATDISVTIDTSRLGPRQTKAYERFCRTGMLVGRSVPAKLAWAVRRELGLPTVRIYRPHWCTWHSMHADAEQFWSPLRVEGTALRTAGCNDYQRNHGAKMLDIVAEKHESYSWLYAPSSLYDVFSDTKFQEAEPPHGLITFRLLDDSRPVYLLR